MRRVSVVLLAIVFCVPAAALKAGVFYLEAQATNAFDIDFNPLPHVPTAYDNILGPIIFEVTVTVDVISLAPGERSFANTGFNINFGGDAEDAFDTGWNPDTRLGDSNGATAGGSVPLWFANTDAGVPGDEKGILVSIANGLTGANDNRRNIGQAPGSQGPVTGTNPYPTGELGTFFVLINKPNDGIEDYIELADILFQSATAFGIFGNTVSAPTVHLSLADVDPEPSSFVLAALGALSMVVRRRATLV